MRTVKFIIPLLLVFACSSCIHLFFEKPTLTLRKINASPSLQGLNLNFGMDVNNPNGYDLKLEKLSFSLTVNDNPSGAGGIDSPILLPARSTSYVEIPVRTDMKALGNVISAMIQGKELRYRVEGDALVTALLGEKNFHFDREGVLTKEMLKR
jgi:LEA14-like dessication related protein